MDVPTVEYLEWMPAIPNWLGGRIEGIIVNYLPSYEHFFDDYFPNGGADFTFNGLSPDAVNGFSDQGTGAFGHITAPWVTRITSTDEIIGLALWNKGATPGTKWEWDYYARCAAWALLVGQVYACLLTQTFIRQYKFGYYGAKKQH